jgi:hypothetical protein
LKRTNDPAAQLALVFERVLPDSDALLAALRGFGLRQITRCRLTRNRNVMVSFGDGELRVHQGYLGAPDDVLEAIVQFVEARTRRERLRARRRLLDYPVDTPPGTVRRRRAASHPEDRDIEERLAQWHRQFNARHFDGRLRTIALRVSRRMRGRLGQYSAATPHGDAPEIAISRRHVRRDGWEQAVETLLHEMVHQWQDESGLPIDHGRSFRMKAREVGIPPHARRKAA